ncbi:MAG: discoidin domain-containing protein [Deltaproteobacteria bacterium]|nr:discoidin domain-containing protein [Deltaproteobacteria bacterium]
MPKKFLLSIFAVFVVSACGGDTVGPKQYTPPEQKKEPDPLTISAPVVHPLTATCEEEIAVRGSVSLKAGMAVDIIVRGGASTSGATAAVDPTTGSFCVPVRLVKGQLNQLQVYAKTPGALSTATEISVEQTGVDCETGNRPTEPTPTKPKNVLAGMLGEASLLGSGGTANAASFTDGDATTWASLKGPASGYSNDPAWVKYKLPKASILSSVRIVWGTDDYYGVEYKILVNNSENAGDPNPGQDGWQEIKDVTDGKGGVDEWSFANKTIQARQIAFYMIDDSAKYWVPQGDWYRIAELEVYLRQESNVVASQPQSVCAAGL